MFVQMESVNTAQCLPVKLQCLVGLSAQLGYKCLVVKQEILTQSLADMRQFLFYGVVLLCFRQLVVERIYCSKMGCSFAFDLTATAFPSSSKPFCR